MANKGANIVVIGAGIGLAILATALLLRQKETSQQPPECTGAFLWGLVQAIGSRPGDPLWNVNYDLDKDNLITSTDFTMAKNGCSGFCNYYTFMNAYGSSVGDANYDPAYDFNEDGVIDTDDFFMFSAVCG